MTFAEIKELLNDGFTPEQITLLTTSGAVPTPAPDEAQREETAPVLPLPDDTLCAISEAEEESAPATPAPAPAPEPAPEPDRNKDIIDAINDLKKTIQAGNILKNSIETVDQDNALERAMAELIRPSFNKNE